MIYRFHKNRTACIPPIPNRHNNIIIVVVEVPHSDCGKAECTPRGIYSCSTHGGEEVSRDRITCLRIRPAPPPSDQNLTRRENRVVSPRTEIIVIIIMII